MRFRNSYYELDYDAKRNQIQWKIKGYWPSVEAIPDLEADWASLLEVVRKPGFNILADLSEMTVPPRDVQEMLTLLHGRLAHGVNKMAIVTSSAGLRRLFRQVGSISGTVYLICHFTNRQQAQIWLDKSQSAS
jgi:hypothetical protein